ncbi:hypothetical protein PDIDSM_5497 [Penicillium digitatum]|nr:hypothetical protein PDIDSM_5497 [Penicillium digitatum]
MRISLSGEEGDILPEKPTLSDVIAQHFDHEDHFGVCLQCGGKKTAKDQIGSFPELLLVQLNRTSQLGKKINTHVYLSERLSIETRFMDERWGNERKVVQYKLTSVVLHHGQDVTRGHYSIGVKGKGDEWTNANDTEISDWDPEGPGGNPNHLATGYLFTYRRLPTDDPVQTLPEAPTAEGDRGTPSPYAMEIDPNTPSDDGGRFVDFDSGPVLPAVPEDSVPKSGSNAWGNDPKALGNLLDVMVPKIVDSYIARSADARRKEWEKWANEWEKKRETVKAETLTSAIGSPIGSDVGTGSSEDIVDWTKQRGRLEITLTGDAGKGAKVLDLEVQELAEQPAGGLSKTQKPLMLTLHCLFPNDFLPALDILDRKLVRQLVRSDQYATSLETVQEDFFLVISASIPPSCSGSSVPFQEKGYEVRLRAWNCSCPTFTLSAYRDSQLPAKRPTNEQNQLAYSFGGTLARGTARVSPPTCKHILACILHARCPELFGADGDGRFAVSKEELAGWCAGWGG